MSGSFVPISALWPGAAPPVAEDDPPWVHLLDGETPLAFVVEGSRLFAIDRATFDRLSAGDAGAIEAVRAAVGASPRAASPPMEFPEEPTSLSLNIAQACNLSCTYCYADEGRFGGKPRLMAEDVALSAIDRLIEGAGGHRVTIGFIGGEPFLNRRVLHRAVAHASARAAERGVRVGFSVTTNATLLTDEDLDLLRAKSFAVTVSLDGDAATNDRHRRSLGGASSGEAALSALRPLLDDPGGARIAARATVTRDDLRIAGRVEALAGAGFREVGVSPLRAGPDPSLALRPGDWPALLGAMIEAGDADWRHARSAGAFRFSNLAIALKELHRGACRPLPCGAAAGYVSVAADGSYYTCHRTIDDARHRLGGPDEGPSREARARFLEARHVDRQQPCRSCWARYLCGGGCHVEVDAAGRAGCDFIRGWLDYALRLYDRVALERPDLLGIEVEG
jgi:uncharacterized protein